MPRRSLVGKAPKWRVADVVGFLSWALSSAWMVACAPGPPTRSRAPIRDSVLVTDARCVGAISCLIGYVSAAESDTPLARASVWFEREGESSDQDAMFGATTDFEGVFVVPDPPPGNYTIGVYRGARRNEFRGVELGAPGTKVAVITLAPR